MKKYIILFSATILIIAATVFTPTVAAMFIPNAKLVMLSKQKYVDYVTANGTIEEKSAKNISVDYPIVAKNVYFSAGDSIKKGDVIADIDKEMSAAMIADKYKTDPSSLPNNVVFALSNAENSSNLGTLKKLIPDSVVSTSSGKLTSLKLAEGELSQSGIVATVSARSNLCVCMQVNESDISQVKKGQSVLFSGAGFSGKTYSGRITKVATTAKKQINSISQETVVDVTASINDADSNLKAGFSVVGSIAVSNEIKVNVLPYEAVRQDDDGNEFVYVYKNGKANKQIVLTDRELQNGIEIKSGITNKDFIIYKANELDRDVEYVNVTVGSVRSD